jgi:hypothetical protein
LYRPDTTNLTSFTRAQLLAKVQNGDTITLMGVPPGSGLRMGIDRNEDGVLDGDTPPPALTAASAAGSLVLNWPYSAAGFALESAPSLAPPAWTSAPNPVEIIGGQNFVTNPASAGVMFFRLHRP